MIDKDTISPKHLIASLSDRTHTIVEKRTGSCYESTAYNAKCTCGWTKIGFQSEVRKAVAKHTKDAI